MIQSWDIDGVILINENVRGLRPYNEDIIITGRSIEEKKKTLRVLREKGICNEVHFQNELFELTTRETSGHHKGTTLARLIASGNPITVHYDDDPIQIEIIRKYVDIPIIHISHDLTVKDKVGIQKEDPSCV